MKAVLDSEAFGKIRFQTIDQIERFCGLRNKLYQVAPNPVLRGWKPIEIDNPPVLQDDIPEYAEDIPIRWDDLFAQYGVREKVIQHIRERFSETTPSRKERSGETNPAPTAAERNTRNAAGEILL